MINHQAAVSTDIAFTDADFKVIACYAAERYGLDIKYEKKGLIYARLARRVRALGLIDFKAYCDFVTGNAATEEQTELLSALTTNVSSFFREKHHFETLKRDVLPGLRQKAESPGGINIWSAGCSAGQEPYSVAATLYETWSDAGQLNIKILGTDVDPRILEKARAANYRATELSALSAPQHHQLFDRPTAAADTFTVRAELRKMISFELLNLVSNWQHSSPFDIIFCRNVVIYFERSTQHRLWRRFSDALTAEGALFIGHSERLSGPAAPNFNNVGVTTFSKRAP